MTDPLDVLFEPVRPEPPDPVFARRLRARLERALALPIPTERTALPRGVVPVTAVDVRPSEPVAAEPRSAAVPYLAVRDARAAIAWYVEVFGARPAEEPIVMPDGRIGHSDLELAGGHLYLADEHPAIGVTAPRPGEAAVSLMLSVDDADAVRSRALAAGASGDRPPYDGYGSRHAWIVDPFGHRWGLTSPLRPAGVAYRHGDVVHLALVTPDVERARAFYADVLGWRYLPDGRVDGSTPSIGFRAGPARVLCDYAVTDLAAALVRLREAGGTPGAIERHPWGAVCECVDDQGTDLRLHEVPAVPDGSPAPPTPDVAYLTLEVVDSARARSFYRALLGWDVAAGRVADGWQVRDTAPMIGISGGHAAATAAPVWTVPDLAAALASVRANGGTATDPHREPYGLLSEATDDQGLRFSLLEG